MCVCVCVCVYKMPLSTIFEKIKGIKLSVIIHDACLCFEGNILAWVILDRIIKPGIYNVYL